MLRFFLRSVYYERVKIPQFYGLSSMRHLSDMTRTANLLTAEDRQVSPQNKSVLVGWLCWCVTALRHILGHFGRGQLT